MRFRNRKTFLSIAIFLIIISGLIYFYENIRIPKLTNVVALQVRRDIDINAMPSMSVAMVVDKEGIAKYTEITEEIVDTKIKMVEVPKKFIPDNAVTDLNSIIGKITKESLKSGEQIISDSFSKEEKWFNEFERLKEYTIKSTVADTLKSGNIVDVLVIYGNGDYDVVIPKVKVKKLVKNNNTENDGKQEAQIVIPVNEIDTRDMIAAKELGEFDIRIYLDESQEKSIKTFDYKKAKEQLQLIEPTLKEVDKNQDNDKSEEIQLSD